MAVQTQEKQEITTSTKGKRQKKYNRKFLTVMAVVAIGLAAPASASFLPGGLDLGSLTGNLGNIGNLGNVGNLGNNLGSSLGGVTDQAQEVLFPIQGYLQQIQNLGSSLNGLLDKVVGDLSEQIKGVIGDLNLPDPEKLLEGLKKDDQQISEASPNSVSGLTPVILKDNTAATVSARVYAQQSLSKEAQTQAKQELEQVGQVAQASGRAAQATGQAGQAATQAAQTATQLAQQAQNRVSTQDALKDLNNVSAAIASGVAAQSNQLSSMSGQLGQDAQIQAIQTAKLSQIATGTAVTVQQLADVNAHLRGQQQAELIKDVAMTDRLNRLTSGAISFMR